MFKEPFRAGFGRADITPRVGVPLAGFGPYLNRNSTEVLKPLMARVGAFQSGEIAALLISLELCGLTRELEARIRSVVAEETGIPEDAIFLGSTHTHSGPQTVGHIGWGFTDDLYVETLPHRVAAAARRAVEGREPATLQYAHAPCEGLAINRELDAAYERHLPVDTFLDPSWRPAKPELTDTFCDLIVIQGKAGPIGLLHHFGCHPVVCCDFNTQIHGDFVGLASHQLEEAHPGVVALFFPGALGDVNPSISHRSPEDSLRALEVIARRYAACVEDGLNSAEPLKPELRVKSRWTAFPRVDWDLATVNEKIRELEERLHQPGIDDNPLEGGDGNPLERRGMDMVRLMGLRKLRDRMRFGLDLNPKARLTGIRLGSVQLLGAPFEIYQSSKNSIRSAVGGERTLVTSLVNGALGYAPDAESYARNGYSAEFVPLMKGDLPHRCVSGVLEEALTGIGHELEGAKRS